jgi:hypothetical protein
MSTITRADLSASALTYAMVELGSQKYTLKVHSYAKHLAERLLSEIFGDKWREHAYVHLTTFGSEYAWELSQTWYNPGT